MSPTIKSKDGKLSMKGDVRPKTTNKASTAHDHSMYDQSLRSSVKGKRNPYKKVQKNPNERTFSQARSNKGYYKKLLEQPSSIENTDIGKYCTCYKSEKL